MHESDESFEVSVGAIVAVVVGGRVGCNGDVDIAVFTSTDAADAASFSTAVAEVDDNNDDDDDSATKKLALSCLISTFSSCISSPQ